MQHRLRAIVTDKLADTQRQVGALTRLSAELHQAAAALERHRPEGACDDHCGCARTTPGRDAVAAVVDSSEAPDDTAAIACTLGATALPARVDDWHALLAHVDRREPVDGGLRLTLAAGYRSTSWCA